MALTDASLRLTSNPRLIQEWISGNVRALLGMADLDRQDLVPVIGVDASGVGRKINGHRKWSIEDVVVLADFFADLLAIEIEPAKLLRDPSQNWKYLHRADLRVLAGGASPAKSSTAGQRAMLFPVPDLPR